MLFNSLDFACFLSLTFLLYWFAANRNLKLQNLLLLAASYFFYCWWDWRFLSLILLSTIVDYTVALKLDKEENLINRKALLLSSIAANLGVLGFFKYYNFFLENFKAAFSFFGSEINGDSLNIILPIGISFYTFQTLSYTIDVYKRKLKPTNNIIDFAAFVAFFPQLVAGPIERATHLLPQFNTKRSFKYNKAVDGLRQILWGLFKKIVIADNCAEYANLIFNNSDAYSGSTLALGTVFFGFQIYGDFSGYSDIAIGTARLFGFDLKANFKFPFFSRNIAEFWRRWHISLSTWFRDYLYIPLGGSKVNSLLKVRNIFLVFVISGLWHGANWTFIAWGALNAVYILPSIFSKHKKRNKDIVAKGKQLPSLKELLSIAFTFTLISLAWILFRANNITHAYNYAAEVFSYSLFSIPEVRPRTTLLLILIFMLVEWIGREGKYGIENFGSIKFKPLSYLLYLSIFLAILLLAGGTHEFIYFRF